MGRRALRGLRPLPAIASGLPGNPFVLLLWGGLWAGWQLLAFAALAGNGLPWAG